MSTSTHPFSIDAVISWVDGRDPAHQAKRRAHQGEANKRFKEASSDTRFFPSGEVYYNIASLFTHAPYLRKVWIVTDNQRPPHLEHCLAVLGVEPDRVSIVDHRQIYAGYEEALPTFNSMALECLLWRIPGLADHFIYLNDDFLLLQPAGPFSFFDLDGRAVLHAQQEDLSQHGMVQKFRSFVHARSLRLKGVDTTRQSSRKAARMLGTQNLVVPKHHPHPQRASIMKDLFARFQPEFERQIFKRFRQPGRFQPIGLCYMEMMARGLATCQDERVLTYIPPSNGQTIDASLLEELKARKYPFGCIQSLDQAADADRNVIQDILDDHFGPVAPRLSTPHIKR